MSSTSPPRKPLHERSDSDSNTNTRTLRLVSNSPQFLGPRDEIFGRTPLPTHPSHILSPGKGKGRGHSLHYEFQHATNASTSTGSGLSPISTIFTLSQPPRGDPGNESSLPKPKPVPKKRLQVHQDTKTFSLVPLEVAHLGGDGSTSPKSMTLSTKSSYDFQPSEESTIGAPSTSPSSSLPETPSRNPIQPTTPAAKSKQSASADVISSSPWNYRLIGGLRKVPRTPDHKQTSIEPTELPPLPETSDAPTLSSHDLSTKPSFHSAETATTTSENTNYKVYREVTPSVSEGTIASPASGTSNYQILGDPSEDSSVIHRPQTSSSENENYEILGKSSPAVSYLNLSRPSQYSHESLVVPPLNPRNRRSNENLGYFKSRSRETLRTDSLTSISTVLSQPEAFRAIANSGALINLQKSNPKVKVSNPWAERAGIHPLRSHMNEYPHQWSSQLSTVHSVSDVGTNRGSQSWSDNGRISSGFSNVPSRQSRQLLSESLEPPERALLREGQRHTSEESQMMGEQAEYGDVITDLRDLRARPSKTRLGGFQGIPLDNSRSNTVRSTGSSRANSLLSSSIPAWARLYYGSGEWRYLAAFGSVSDGTNSRSSSFRSFRSGSPNTDHFPMNLYSPRRRPRQDNHREPDPVDVTPAPQMVRPVQTTRRSYSGPLRTWSLSSVWSPHLRLDRRATRYSVWDPPSISWSTEGGYFGRRNVQIVMFIAGFIFPFAWMIAAFLPLPHYSTPDMLERDRSTSNLDSSNAVPNDYARYFGPMNDIRYESAKWWRNLNRCMSAVGVLIIAVVIILVVLSAKDAL